VSTAKRDPAAARATGEAFRAFAESRDPALREQLIIQHANLANYLASRFAGRGEPLEDIAQVAQLGLLNAVDRYDPSRGVEFSTYATATIVGEIKRHFRDKTWAIRVPRRLRERNNVLMRTMQQLALNLGRSPTLLEIAEAAGVSFEDAVEALEVGRAYNPVSLDAQSPAGDANLDGQPLMDQIGIEDPELERFEDKHIVDAALATLPDREQTILRMRYYEERSQADIAHELGISQMHVSRLQRAAIEKLAAKLAKPHKKGSAKPE
jgi:RNA polymerase sigma-B factor